MSTALLKKIIALFVFIFIFISYAPALKSINAAEACTATVSPTSVVTGSSQSMSFSVTNSGDVNIIYIKVTRPSSNFTLFNNGGIPGPWTATVNSTEAELSGGTLNPDSNLSFTIGANIASNEAASADWTIQVYGSAFANCTGTLGTAITGAGDTTGPVLSQPSAGNIDSSSATISWTTDEASDSKVNYGTTLSYGTIVSSGTLTTSHSINLTGLSANTTYNYSIESKDASGNSSTASGYNFTTAASGLVINATPTPTSAPGATATPTPTGTGTPTPTPTPTIERVPPRVSITTEIEGSYEEAPVIEGTATDNVGVVRVDYSTDGGVNWLPVDTAQDLGTKSTEFSFTPFIFDDGDYEIVVRALDDADNTGTSDTFTVVLDRLPPRVGGVLLSLGPQPLQPDENGVIITLSGLPMRITMSTVGGATGVDLLATSLEGEKEPQKFELSHSTELGLWSGDINLNEPGLYQLSTQAVDGAGNRTERVLGRVLIVEPGLITYAEKNDPVKDSSITLFIKDPLVGLWAVWDGKPFGQSNPQRISDEGNYQYFLPPGQYYLEIKTPGHQALTSVIFRLEKSTPLNSDFEVETPREIVFLGLHFSLPDFFAEKAPVVLKSNKVEAKPEKVDAEASSFILPTTGDSEFELTDARGKAHVLSFISTWSPPALEQVSVLDNLITEDLFPGTMIISHETLSKSQVFKRKGNYQSDIVVDRDGELIEDYGVSFLPTHYFLDRTGKVEDIVTGVLNKEEMKERLGKYE